MGLEQVPAKTEQIAPAKTGEILPQAEESLTGALNFMPRPTQVADMELDGNNGSADEEYLYFDLDIYGKSVSRKDQEA